VYAAISIDDIVESTTYKQAVKSPLCDKWKMAMKNEIQSLKNNNTWTLSNAVRSACP
jgi:L-rhamnose mutarotase